MKPSLTKLVFALCGLLFAVASRVPETLLSLVLVLVVAALFVFAARREDAKLWDYYLFGLLFSAFAFYWLPDTIILFGGLPAIIGYLVFVLFCVTGALQFVVCGVLYRFLKRSPLQQYLLALPLAWLSASLLIPRMFPWEIGHCLIYLSSIAGLAEYVGVPLLSFLLICWGELCVAMYESLQAKKPIRVRGQVLVAGLTLLCIVVGQYRAHDVARELADATRVKMALIQGNLSAKDKGDIRLLEANVEQYRKLSSKAQNEGAEFIIWPESVLNQFTPEDARMVRGTRVDPAPELSVPLLYGTLSFRKRSSEEVDRLLEAQPALDTPRNRKMLRYLRFNSAFGIDEEGNVVGNYHKKVLMPFGEYVPFGDIFPWLKAMIPVADFSPGYPEQRVITFTGEQDGEQRRSTDIVAGILICYEDLIPSLSANSLIGKPNVLVNLTNDAWYGDTAAPYQHHLLALWRAIETRRYFLRVTNTGYTGVVDPFGQTIASLELFTEGYLLEDVPLLNGSTLYAKILDMPAWILCLLSFIAAFFLREETSQED